MMKFKKTIFFFIQAGIISEILLLKINNLKDQLIYQIIIYLG